MEQPSRTVILSGNDLPIASLRITGTLILVMDITEACKSLNISGIRLEKESMQITLTKQEDEIKFELQGLLGIVGDGDSGLIVADTTQPTEDTLSDIDAFNLGFSER